MGQLRIPKGAEDSIADHGYRRFRRPVSRSTSTGLGSTVGLWLRDDRPAAIRDSGLQPLEEGDWPRLLEMLDACGFWSLPEDGSHLVDPTVVVLDGEWLTIAGRQVDRSHRIERFVWREPGLDALLSLGCRVSGLDVPVRASRVIHS